MTDIVLEAVRALLLAIITASLWRVGRQHKLNGQEGWRPIWFGFFLLFLGSVIDISDNFPSLNHLILLGDTPTQAFLEKVVGYLLGTILIAHGFWRWMPNIVVLREAQAQLRLSHDELERSVRERTAELRETNLQLRREITERNEVEQRLFEEKERLHVTLESIGDGVITTDIAGDIQYLNPVAEHLTGYEQAHALGKHYLQVLQLVDESTGETLSDLVTLCLHQDGGVVHADDGVLTHHDGTRYTINVSASAMRDNRGTVIGAVLVLHDITEVMDIARQLSYQASHDMLTGLANRREFERVLDRAIRAARSGGEQHVLLYLDLDQFKLVNDSCGHRAGDELLLQLATLLRRVLKQSDTLARLGGDEFGVLLENTTLAEAESIADHLRQIIKELRFVWQNRTFEVGVSIGVVTIDQGAGHLTDVLIAADTACYVAKNLGRNRIHVYEHDDADVVNLHGEISWVHRIMQAFEENYLTLYAQPIVAIGEGADEETHYEVLMRMRGGDGEIVCPMAFIPAAERYNLMPTLDRWVVRTTLGLLRQAQGPGERPPITCCINLSGHSLGDEHFLDFVVTQFHEADVAPEYICFEITETAAISNLSRALHFIEVLRGMGCRFALDDFGSGVSSFGYLKSLQVDYLKIDGSFVRDMLRDSVDRAMVESINQIGHVMGLKTIAEYVENDDVIAELQVLGVDYAQGYHFGQPLPLDEVLRKLAPETTKYAAS